MLLESARGERRRQCGARSVSDQLGCGHFPRAIKVLGLWRVNAEGRVPPLIDLEVVILVG